MKRPEWNLGPQLRSVCSLTISSLFFQKLSRFRRRIHIAICASATLLNLQPHAVRRAVRTKYSSLGARMPPSVGCWAMHRTGNVCPILKLGALESWQRAYPYLHRSRNQVRSIYASYTQYHSRPQIAARPLILTGCFGPVLETASAPTNRRRAQLYCYGVNICSCFLPMLQCLVDPLYLSTPLARFPTT